ncbi:MAG TPA: hypothetical protein VK544_07365 [Gemmatimonadaceae bacterium]|jgi:hypothetical protein|nr:hypothetical protein [Gemmatimonadaceae bacterium]
MNIMVNRGVSLAIIVGALAVAGCRGNGDSDPVPASLPGSYAYDARGSTFKKQWAFSTRLDLTPDRHFTLTLDKTIDGKTDPTETSTGAYAVDGDHILLREVRPAIGVSEDVHKLQIKADSLIAEVGWTGELFLKGVGAPNIVFVKQRGS